ncbi:MULTISPECIES: hypothetical protein [unclassified Sporosarcina]|uniref:hypothetical protein n=1 Tax=unclassified Sporosarcina TaxID=2647733 RepID=UPI000C16C533|nr:MULTISPECIES: hypothetical protein [unclassified Sporosarcina]PID01157.1 hypothetical protein CSV67_15605 [Sporosarcina sp. P2]PID23757.1 hypothetical protein CSV60_13395 [Sporosarcina sp. P7]
MKKGNIVRGLFTGVFVGIISLIKELFFSGLNSFFSIALMVAAALIGYWLGNKVLMRHEEKRNSKTTT